MAGLREAGTTVKDDVQPSGQTIALLRELKVDLLEGWSGYICRCTYHTHHRDGLRVVSSGASVGALGEREHRSLCRGHED